MERVVARMPRDPLEIVASMFAHRRSEQAGLESRRGLDRWLPERSAAFPDAFPDDPAAIDESDPRIGRGCELRRIAELREQRNVGRMLDLIWAGRVLRTANEAQADPVLDAQMRAVARMLRDHYGLKGPLPDDPSAALRQVIDLSACPVPWRRLARRR